MMTEWTLDQMRRMGNLLGRRTSAKRLLDVAELTRAFARENAERQVADIGLEIRVAIVSPDDDPAPNADAVPASERVEAAAEPREAMPADVADAPAACAVESACSESTAKQAAPVAATPAKKPAAPRAPAAKPKVPVGAAWTDEDIATLRRMRAEGYTASAIGQHLGRTTRSIQLALHRLVADTLAKPSQAPRAEPATAASPAEPDPVPAAAEPAPALHAAPPVQSRPKMERDSPIMSGWDGGFEVPELASGPKVQDLVREVLQHLGSLDQEGFTPADDLLIGQMVVGRQGFDIIAGHLGCEPNAAKNRWEALRRLRAITTERGHLTIDGQTALLRALAIRAEDVADVA